MKNYSSKQTKKGRVSYRTPSSFRNKKTQLIIKPTNYRRKTKDSNLLFR